MGSLNGVLDIFIHLRDSVTQSHQIAARRFGSAAGRVRGKFCFVQPQQQGALLPQTFNCSQIDLFFRPHTRLYRLFERIVFRRRKCACRAAASPSERRFYLVEAIAISAPDLPTLD
jgi:hypothetical protein